MEITQKVLFHTNDQGRSLMISTVLLQRDPTDGQLYWTHQGWDYPPRTISAQSLPEVVYVDKRHVRWEWNKVLGEWIIPYVEGDL